MIADERAAVGRAVEAFEHDVLGPIRSRRLVDAARQLVNPPMQSVAGRQAPWRRRQLVQLRQLVIDTLPALDRAEEILPHVIEHAGRGEAFGLGLDLPTAEHGEDLSREPYDSDYADPTGEQVVNRSRTPEDDDVVAIRRIVGDLGQLRQLTAAIMADCARLDSRLPAVADALASCDEPTDGRHFLETEEHRQLVVDTDSTCLACDQPTSECGPLHAGLCDADHDEWRASGLDRHTWLHDYIMNERGLRNG